MFPDLEELLQEVPGGTERALHRAIGVVGPADGDLEHRDIVLLEHVEVLAVEGEPVDPLAEGQEKGDVPPYELIAALHVLDALDSEERADEKARPLPHEPPEEALGHGELRPFLVARGDDHRIFVDIGTELREALEVGREVRVHEEDVVALRRLDEPSHVMALPLLAFVRKEMEVVGEHAHAPFHRPAVDLVRPVHAYEHLVVDPASLEVAPQGALEVLEGLLRLVFRRNENAKEHTGKL